MHFHPAAQAGNVCVTALQAVDNAAVFKPTDRLLESAKRGTGLADSDGGLLNSTRWHFAIAVTCPGRRIE